jgi:ZIP family zinc transporter
MVILIGLATFLSTLLGGLFAIRFKDRLHLILGFSAGAVIGVALFDLIPESISLGTKAYNLSEVTLLIAIGFAVYMTLDRFFSLHLHAKRGEDCCEKENHRGKLAAGSLLFHSFLDGLGIGLAFKISPTVGWIVAAAVLAHDFSDGINTVNVILKNSGSRGQAFRWLLADAIAPVVGVGVTFLFTVPSPVLGLILAIFAGFFLYIGASELIPESHHRHPSRWTTISTILGIGVLYLITFLVK